MRYMGEGTTKMMMDEWLDLGSLIRTEAGRKVGFKVGEDTVTFVAARSTDAVDGSLSGFVAATIGEAS